MFLPLWIANTAVASACHFTTECFETDACSETDFSVSIEAGDKGPDHMVMVTPAETLDVTAGGSENLAHYLSSTETALHILSVTPGGAARYTVHMEGPLSVSYSGQCEPDD